MSCAELLFWGSFLFIAYTYLGYPLLLGGLSRVVARPVRKQVSDVLPSVSVVIAARNEEQNICRRLDNLLEQDYPPERLEIIVVSDGSTDRTNELVAAYASPRVRLVALTSGSGKAVAVNAGVVEAHGEIVVFADSRQRFAPDVVRRLTDNFSDPTIGCVSGELVFEASPGSGIQTEMGAYWQYEKWIRKQESATGSVVGVTGAIYAMRRSLYRPLPKGTILDDVVTPLNVIEQGYRCIFDGSALAFDPVSKDMAQEWSRKVRTMAGNWQMLGFSPRLLLPGANPVWLRFISHKICRLLVPFALLTLPVGAVSSEGFVYQGVFLVWLVVCIGALLGALSRRGRCFRLVSLFYFVAVMNVAACAGLVMWVRGQSNSVWKPAEN